MKPYRIIGQGLAGSILSMQLYEKGIPHTVWDNPSLSSSSKIAAGLINPVVLKRLKLVHEAQAFYDSIRPFYTLWEKRLHTPLLHSAAIAHIFQSQGEQNTWIERSGHPSFAPFLGEVKQNVSPLNTNLSFPYGVGFTQNTFWLDAARLIEVYRKWLSDKGMYKSLTSPTLEIPADTNVVNIWCTGHLFKDQVSPGIFAPTRGELLLIHSKELPENIILHAGVFVLPLGQGHFKVGATYAWDQLKDQPTPEGRDKLETQLQKIFSGSYQVIDHLAGVRPTIKDRKPVLGRWKDELVFNGLGSRGTFLAPRLGAIFSDWLLQKTAIPQVYDIQRFT